MMPTLPPDQLPPSPSFFDAVRFWLKLGLISFGGPAGQIAIMHQELVEKRFWISEKRFLHALNYCMVLPGPEAQQLASYIGWLMHGTKGGVVAGVLFVLPSLLILIVLSWLYIAFGELPLVAGIFYGIKPAVTAIVIHAAHRIGSRTLKNASLWSIAIVAFLLVFAIDCPFPLIIIAAAMVGFLGGRFIPQHFVQSNKHTSGAASTAAFHCAALIDDDTPMPLHAQFSWPRFARVLAFGLVLWCVPMISLMLFFGWDHIFTQMAWFFTKAALLTFGGAYAVLPYVMQGAVFHYAWLTPTQMMDGLALGETTPGPLIIVLAFVGFVGAYVKAVFGPDQLFLAGASAAVLVTWFTFLPSFIFILAGGPIIEATHNELRLTAPLQAITAAVVGVVVNLAVFFSYHVIWPHGFGHQLDWVSAGMTIAAAMMLFRYKCNVMLVILVCALAGLGFRLFTGS